MQLKCISVKNFRCFDELTLDVHPELTVLVAPNGAGKTTLLDAARIAVWPLVKAFDLGSQTGKSATIQIEDVRIHRQESGNQEPVVPAKVIATGFWDGDAKEHRWTQTRKRLKARTNTLSDSQTNRLTQWGGQLQEQVRSVVNKDHTDKVPVNLPLVVYLGTGRLWYQGRYTSVAKHKKLEQGSYSRTWGYQNCITASSSYKQFEDWYSWVYRSYREQQIIALERNLSSGDKTSEALRFKHIIQVVQGAVNQVIQEATGWQNIAYSESHQQQIVLSHPQQGDIPLSMLSDGLRNAVVMVADIAFRCSQLNPHFADKAALRTSGMVLIDEVDMFLHPAWQQTIIGSLRQAFPKIQFIVTTHSPQVLSTCKADQIRILEESEEGISIHTPTLSPYGRESTDALSLMNVHARPPLDIWEQAHTYEQLVRSGKESHEKAQQIKQQLDDAGYDIPNADLALWRFLAQQNLRE